MGYVVRVIVVHVSGLSDEHVRLCTKIYDRYKRYIPKECEKISRYTGGSLSLRLPEDSDELKEAIAFMQDLGLSLRFFSETHFTPKEIREAPFYVARLPSPYELQGDALRKYGTKFVGGCRVCGIGRKPHGDILINKTCIKKFKMCWVEPLYLVSDPVRLLLEKSGLTGFRIGPEVKDYRGRETPPFYAFEIESVLPPVSSETWFETSHINPCFHPRPLYLRSDLRYEREKLENTKEFNCTQEELNNYHTREMVLSANAREFFKENKIYANFTPLTIL